MRGKENMIETFLEWTPRIHPSAYVHPTACIIGNVIIEADCSIWPYAVIRGDMGLIHIQEGTNIQEHVLIHCDKGSSVSLGKYVTVGHQAILHGTHIEDEVLVGMGSIVLDYSHIKKHSIVGAAALVTSNKTFPEKSLILGSPAKVVKEVSEPEVKKIRENAEHYVQLKDKRRGKQ